MHSVILTELGISVFNEGAPEKAFPFKDAVSEYLSIKKKESKLSDLIEYLHSIQTGVKTSDKSLLLLLKKSSIDAQIMEEKELEEVQTSKPQIIVDSGFAKDVQDALGKLRDFSLGLSSSKVTEASESPDLHIIQAISTLDEIDRIANALSSRLREWYGLHFPELDNIVDSINGYAQIVLGGKRDALTREVLEGAGFPESKVEMISLVASNSRGGDISEVNLSIVQSIARQIIDFYELRKKLEGHIETQMNANAPNLSAILGTAVGARMLGRAGSLQRLASLPASTIQILGAEKALFRSLKTGSQPPKHGLLFQHAMVHAAPRWQRGKIARAIAAKAVIAARVDVYGEGLNRTLLDKLNVRVVEIGKKYEKPAEREPKPESTFRRGGGGGGGGSSSDGNFRKNKWGDSRGRDRDRTPKDGHDPRSKKNKKNKKRKKFGRR